MTHAYRVILLSLLCLCTGTACSAGPPDHNKAAEANSARTVVILAVTHDQAVGKNAIAMVDLDPQPSAPGKLLKSNPSPLFDSEFDDRQGQLYILDVDPGQHSFDAWMVVTPAGRLLPNGRPPTLSFNIKAGQVLYLGEMHFALAVGQTDDGRPIVTDTLPVIEDQSERDIRLAVQRVPALKGKIRKALLPIGPWSPVPPQDGPKRHAPQPPSAEMESDAADVFGNRPDAPTVGVASIRS